SKAHCNPRNASRAGHSIFRLSDSRIDQGVRSVPKLATVAVVKDRCKSGTQYEDIERSEKALQCCLLTSLIRYAEPVLNLGASRAPPLVTTASATSAEARSCFGSRRSRWSSLRADRGPNYLGRVDFIIASLHRLFYILRILRIVS